MRQFIDRSFAHSTQGKIIFATLFACAALWTARAVTKAAFREMQGAVQRVSAPGDRLRRVNDLLLKIPRLDEWQQEQVLRGQGNYYSIFRQAVPLNRSLDTLLGLCVGDSSQVARIDRLKDLLWEREHLFGYYLRLRDGLIEDSVFSRQVRDLKRLAGLKPKQGDSLVVTSEKQTVTTTVVPRLGPVHQDTRRKGFLRKIFGKKKEESSRDTTAYQVVREELRTRVDTISRASKDSTGPILGASVQEIVSGRAKRREAFAKREADLAATNERLMTEILRLLREVESDAVRQVGLEDARTVDAVRTGAARLNFVVLFSFLLSGILLFLILGDVAKTNRYRREAERARDEAERQGMAKQRFLSNMSHEIRTPLQSIIGYTEKMGGRSPAGPGNNQGQAGPGDVDAIGYSARHLMRVVDEVLDYQRMVSGRMTFSRETFDLPALLEEVVSVLRPQTPVAPGTDLPASVALRTELQLEGIRFMSGDPFRLKRVLYNLLGNALKFTPAGEVTLAVSVRPLSEEAELTFQVRDTGIGIAAADLERVFQEFEQGDGARGRGGAGLGLTIARAIVEGQGGTLRVASEPGKGSCFEFGLRMGLPPAVPAPVEAVAPDARTAIYQAPAGTASLLRHAGGLVWIVDDDRFLLEVCAGMLEKHGVPFRCFRSSEDALSALPESALACVFVDIRMPGMDGKELASRLRKAVPERLRICALTAQVLPEEREALLSGDFDELLAKPFVEEDLVRVLRGSLQDGWNSRLVERMTLGDHTRFKTIWHRFLEDCRSDGASLARCVEEGNLEGVLLLVHRLAGRIGQMGGKALAGEFRLLEWELLRDRELGMERRARLVFLSERLEMLVGGLSADRSVAASGIRSSGRC